MEETATINLRSVARGTGVPLRQIQAVVELLDEGNTVPFITRYRKDQTGGLDEEQIRQIQGRLTKARLLAERKQTIIRSIEAQGKLTEALAKQIQVANTTKRLEDLYLPFKPKKQTLATLARSRGLEPLAQEILDASPLCANLDERAADFVSTDRKVPTAADALLGAGHILAEQFSERAELRGRLRDILQKSGSLISAQTASAEKAAAAEKADSEKSSSEEATVEKAPTPSEPEQDAAAPTESETELPETPPATPTESVEPKSEQPVKPVAESEAGEATAEAVNTEDQRSAQPEVEQETSSPAEETPVEQPFAEQAATEEASVEEPSAAKPPAEKPPAKRAKPAKAEPKLSKAQLRKKKAREKLHKAFCDYFDYREEIKKIPPHRVLALNRGERAKVLRVKVGCDIEAMHATLDELLIPAEHPHADFLRGCARDALTRLILPALEREIRRELTERAETHAVSVFARNLRNLLLQPPVRDRRVLAVDPGFKSGCKLVALDQFGNVLGHDVIYLVGNARRREQARGKVLDLVNRFQLSVATIGNGTACREAEEFFAKLTEEELSDKDVAYVIVNEAGASVYSTSRLGREEFPNYDATLRGAVSIGRRLQDPLSELVKIDPASIGVGLYQHDVRGKHLRESLDAVVESCVNYVGVDVNTASPALLNYVSGLNQLTARRVYEHRLKHGPFRNRQQLKDVTGLGEATFVQAVGFLKIGNSDNPLDATWIHPESYEISARVLQKLEGSTADLGNQEGVARLAERIAKLDRTALAEELGVGKLSLDDILTQLARPGRDPREDLPAPIFKRGVLKLEDLTPGMELTGTVLNVVDFGAFVDIGMHDSGLVHVSQLADKFVRDPHEVVAVGNIVKVWVVSVDKERRRVSLTMIAPGSERPAPRRGSKPADGKEGAGRGRRPPAGKKPRSKGPPRGKQQRPAKPKYKPKAPRKPLVPITEAMKTGAEPMRTFSDLAQFFQATSAEESANGGKQKKAATANNKSRGTSDQKDASDDEVQNADQP